MKLEGGAQYLIGYAGQLPDDSEPFSGDLPGLECDTQNEALRRTSGAVAMATTYAEQDDDGRDFVTPFRRSDGTVIYWICKIKGTSRAEMAPLYLIGALAIAGGIYLATR